MTSRYIRAQNFTHTKSHEERVGPLTGIANSTQIFGTGVPLVAFSDMPLQDSSLLLPIFPSLSRDVMSPGELLGLKSLVMPDSVMPVVVDNATEMQLVLGGIVMDIENRNTTEVVFMDAEWNISRNIGVSCIQLYFESVPEKIFIFRVSHPSFED
jgi:hypothetical protein